MRRRLQIFAVTAALATASAAAASFRVVQPAAEETVHSNSGNVAVALADALPGALLRPMLDGQPAGGPRASPSFDLQGVPRGSHQLVVVAVDAQGHELARTAPVEFYVWHASRLMRHGPP